MAYDLLPFPLNYWVTGERHEYQGVMAKTGWSRAKARKQVHRALRRLGHDPRTDQDYANLLLKAREGRLLQHDLM